MSNDLNRRQRARLSRDRWIAHHSAVQNNMQEHISALQRQVAELISDVVRKDSEIQRLVNTVRDQAHITDNLHDHEKTSTTDILEEKDSVRKNAETQTTNTNTSATQHTAGAQYYSTETKLSQQESGVQTEKDHQCNIGTQTPEGDIGLRALRINVDSTNRENRSTLERLSHELAEAKGQIKQMAESRENTFEYARSLLRTAQQNHKDMIDDLKGDHKRKEDEFRKEIDRMRSEYEAKIRNKEVLLMNHVTHHRNKPEAPGSREPEAPRSREPEAPRSGEAQASRSRELEIQPSKEPEAQPSREPEAQPRESPPAPELLVVPIWYLFGKKVLQLSVYPISMVRRIVKSFQGNVVHLGCVSCCTIEQEGRRGILFNNTSQFSKKSVLITFPGSNKNYEVILEAKQSRVFHLTADFHSMKEAYLTSEIGEPKVLPFLWRSLPRFEDHIRTTRTPHAKSSAKSDEPPKKKAKMSTPVRQSRRLQNH